MKDLAGYGLGSVIALAMFYFLGPIVVGVIGVAGLAFVGYAYVDFNRRHGGTKTKTKTLWKLSKAESRAVDRLLTRMRGGNKGEDNTIAPDELTAINRLIKRMRSKKG